MEPRFYAICYHKYRISGSFGRSGGAAGRWGHGFRYGTESSSGLSLGITPRR
jgi:hypothetical protein